MPIRPENRSRYPRDWKAISHRIRFDRAKSQCECVGECGVDHDENSFCGERCTAEHGKPHPVTGANVVLTTAHLPGRDIEQCGDGDLKAMCQRCHNRMDAPMRRAGIKSRAKAKMAAADLFDSNELLPTHAERVEARRRLNGPWEPKGCLPA